MLPPPARNPTRAADSGDREHSPGTWSRRADGATMAGRLRAAEVRLQTLGCAVEVPLPGFPRIGIGDRMLRPRSSRPQRNSVRAGRLPYQPSNSRHFLMGSGIRPRRAVTPAGPDVRDVGEHSGGEPLAHTDRSRFGSSTASRSIVRCEIKEAPGDRSASSSRVCSLPRARGRGRRRGGHGRCCGHAGRWSSIAGRVKTGTTMTMPSTTTSDFIINDPRPDVEVQPRTPEVK